MKLIIQIPCFNEEATLGVTLSALPRSLPSIDQVEVMIVDDGSVDGTVRVAQEHGVHHIVRFKKNRGLAAAFMAGIERAWDEGADIIVNLDADNQYHAGDIDKLIEPILKGRADLVIGTRQISNIHHFSVTKKALQKLGSLMVRIVSRTSVEDAPSGFRAISREAAMQLKVFSEYTYTLETIIQAGHKHIALECVPIRTNEDLRPSRLVKSIPGYIIRSILTMFRIFIIYRPYPFFMVPGLASFCAGVLVGLRFTYFYFTDGGAGHVQSVILCALLIGMGLALLTVGIIADLISTNRRLLEHIDWRLKRMEGGRLHLDGRGAEVLEWEGSRTQLPGSDRTRTGTARSE